ncbi:alpha/beta fold hydrolase [bacterium]|nr:alpha/beta fold hydrolase [bacterium]
MLFSILVILLAGYVAYALFFLLTQRRKVFPRHRIPYDEVLIGPPEDAEVLWFSVEEGEAEAWFFKPIGSVREQPWPLAVVAHGNGEVLDRWPWKVQSLRERGFAVLLVEFPGYGRSSGIVSQENVTSMMVQSYDEIIQRPEIDPQRVMYVGRSLGTGAVCALAAHRQPKALLLISPFTSIRDHAVRRLLPPILVKDPFDNLSVLREFDGDVMIVHGQKDRLNPLNQAERLNEAASNSRILIYPDAAHHNCPPDWIELWKECDSFFTDAELLPYE